MHPSTIRGLLFLLFALSGFSGLIYESIWTRYLGLFLGHAAYAQTLVLVIFMGGMALGAWIVARWSHRLPNLLLCYAIVEAAIALLGVGFHPLFVALMGVTFDSIIPALDARALVNLAKWSIAAALVFPQSLLLGATFPIMSGAMVRRFPDLAGRSIAILYFTNSMGAAVGVLIAGFVLIAWGGLPGTILSAAIINVWLALALWVVSRTPGWHTSSTDVQAPSPLTSAPRAFLLAAAITGTASFMYEIGWIRMLSLVMGSSTHAFELMLSAFILGLALGSFWIRRRIESLRDPVGFLGIVQVVMGALALSTLFGYGATFDWMSALLRTVARTDEGYVLFNLASHTLAIVVMVPTTFCAGMTLPLITHHLLAGGVGERAIGQVYAANTAGAIVGILVTVHLALPFAGLKAVIVLGAALDIGLGIYLIHRLAPSKSWPGFAVGAAGLVALIASMGIAELDSARMAAGVYRTGKAMIDPGAEVVFHRDGKTATVDVVRYESLLVISTNGKPDASITTTPDPDAVRNGDVQTQVLLGTLPLAARPDARTAAVVGFGAGFTTHALLGSPAMDRVTTVEIEPAMVAGAREFLPRMARALEDPRSAIEIEDAKTFFANAGKTYDVIVSEPSNPWVSGVAGLFSREFYALAKRYLSPGGVFCQWLHVYEIDDALASTVVLALEPSFAHYEIYAAHDGDIVILASDAPLTFDFDFVLSTPGLADELEMSALRTADDLRVRRIGSERLLGPLIASYAGAANSDYFPVLDLNAARARFMELRAVSYREIANAPIPLIEMLDPVSDPEPAETSVSLNRVYSRAARAHFAMAVRDFVDTPDFEASVVNLRPEGKDVLLSLMARWQRCGGEAEDDFRIGALLDLADATVPYLTPNELEDMWSALERQGCMVASARRDRWFALVRAVSARDASRMAALSRSILSAGAQRQDALRRERLREAAALDLDTLTTDDVLKGDRPGREQFRRLTYLVMAGMSGSLGLEDPAGAIELWEANGGSLMVNDQPPPALRLLIALAAEREAEREGIAMRR
jgi:spermidine synthase